MTNHALMAQDWPIEHKIQYTTLSFLGELVEADLEPIGSTVYGSHLYGTSHAGSDIDIRAIHLPSMEQVLSGDVVSVKEGKSGDCVSFSLHKFFQILANGSINALELLYAIDNKDFAELHGMFNIKWIDATRGFIVKHQKRYPNDLKAARHSYRCALMLQEIWRTGMIVFPHQEQMRERSMGRSDCEYLYREAIGTVACIGVDAASLPKFRQDDFIGKCTEVRDRIYSRHLRRLF